MSTTNNTATDGTGKARSGYLAGVKSILSANRKRIGGGVGVRYITDEAKEVIKKMIADYVTSLVNGCQETASILTKGNVRISVLNSVIRNFENAPTFSSSSVPPEALRGYKAPPESYDSVVRELKRYRKAFKTVRKLDDLSRKEKRVREEKKHESGEHRPKIGNKTLVKSNGKVKRI